MARRSRDWNEGLTRDPRHNPTQETMNRLLKPFRLKLSPV